jgi:tRNA(Ile)-lysidine synthase
VHDFVRKLATEWRRLDLAVEGQTIVLAVSGGADSLSLLLAIDDLRKRKKLELRVVAAHFNHRLRGDASDSDERFVAELTSKLKIELAIGRSAGKPTGNLEQSAREERYAFLATTAANVHASMVLTAHTINDQAETFLMNLLRGSGIGGLSGMKAIRPLTAGLKENAVSQDLAVLLVRPLLTWAKRVETEGFCRDLGVEYCHDTMNEDTAYKRVRIRRILLPLLADFKPNIIEVLANTSFLLGNVRSLSDDGNRVGKTDELELRILQEQSEAEQYDTIRGWLTNMRGNTRQLGLKHIKAVARLALSPKSGRVVEVPGGRVLKSGGRLRYDDNKVEKKVPDN